jgi:outer membrane protein assembly factor BamB
MDAGRIAVVGYNEAASLARRSVDTGDDLVPQSIFHTAASTACFVACLMVMHPTARGDDWPQWRGPNRDALSAEANWSGANPQRLWDRDIGIGCGSMAVFGDRVFVMGWRDGKDILYCLNGATGEPIWQFDYTSPKWDVQHEGGPACTPAVRDGRVFIVSREALMHAVDADSGKLLWRRDLGDDYGVRPPRWGFSGSVLALEDKVVVDVGVTVALNPATGEEMWKSNKYPPAYSSPVTMNIGSRAAIVSFPQPGVVVLDANNGQTIASYEWTTSYGVNAATPIVDDSHIFISSGYGTGCALLRVAGERLTRVWQSKGMRNQFASCVVVDGYLYGFDDRVLKCLELNSGKEQWKQRGTGMGGIMAAGDKLIIMTEDGKLIIAEASPRGFNPISETDAVRGRCWVMPVLANGRVLCRSNPGHLAAFGVGR